MFHKLWERLNAKGISASLNEPMSRHTSFRVGGPAALFIEPNSIPQTEDVMATLRASGAPWFYLGNGSNLLVTDDSLDLAAVHFGDSFAGVERRGETGLYAQAGAALNTVCRTARDLGLSGLSFAYGIPGTVGGGVYMNAGAYGGELKDVVHRVDFLDGGGNLRSLAGDELEFGYRHSVFSGRDWCVLGADFALTPGEEEAIGQEMKDVYQRRREKQPLEFPSAGSTFKRPEGAYAAALIDQCGLKGFSVGGAQVSEKHAGFVINRGGATCKDILALMAAVQETVFEKTGFRLEREVKLLGKTGLIAKTDTEE